MKQRHAKRVQELQNDELNRVRAQQNSLKLLSQEERADIVRKLKSKWDAVNIEYQKSSTLDLRIMTGARGKIRRKEQFEAELQQIESYIDRLTAKRNVFVKA